MEAHTFFLYLLIILLAARLFAEIAVRLKSPSVSVNCLPALLLARVCSAG